MANFVKTVSNNLHYGSGYISSVRTFAAPNIAAGTVITDQINPLYSISGDSNSLIGNLYQTGGGIKYLVNLFPDVSDSGGQTRVFVTNVNNFFAQSGISIQGSQSSKLSMYLKFNTETTPTVVRELRQVFRDVATVPVTVLSPISGYPTESKIGFRIKANDQVIHTVTNNYDGYLDITVPAGATNITLETYDTAAPNLILPTSGTYFKTPEYSVLYNDLKIYIPNKPSIPILNNTKAGNFEFIEYEDASSVSIDNCSPVSGYYNIVLGQSKNGVPVDYFEVGDQFRSEVYPNVKPLNTNKNTILKFPVPDFSYVDINSKIELVLEIEGVDTENSEYFRSESLEDHQIRTFYSGPFDFLNISCETSTGDFPISVANVSSISGSNKQTSFVKGGLLIFDITQDVKSAILAEEHYINVILKYNIVDDAKVDKYKHISFRIGNRFSNRPRLRYVRRSNIPVCDV